MTECSNSFFCLQKRRGQGDGRGFAAKVIGTLDNIRDVRPPPFRILLQTVRTPLFLKCLRHIQYSLPTINLDNLCVMLLLFFFWQGGSDFSYVVAVAQTLEEITTDWKWLEEILVPTLGI